MTDTGATMPEINPIPAVTGGTTNINNNNNNNRPRAVVSIALI